MPYTGKTSDLASHHITPSSDYRLSHIRKGEEYEAEIHDVPIDAYISAIEERILAGIVRQHFPGGIQRYVDFACGTGRIARLIEPMATESFGVDVSAPMLVLARARCARTRFACCDITREPLSIPRADLITAFRFFGNAQDELRRSALAGLRELLADDGYLIINNHRNPWSLRNLLVRITGGTLPDYRGRQVDLHYWKLKRLLNDTGFRVLRTYSIGFWIVRAALERHANTRSRFVRLLESVSSLRLLAPFCPDAVIVAVPSSRR